MRLVHKDGSEVAVDDPVTDFRGEPATVVAWCKPHKPASSKAGSAFSFCLVKWVALIVIIWLALQYHRIP